MLSHLPKKLSRRNALKSIGALGALGAVTSTGHASIGHPKKLSLKKGSVVVFQGDSITDAGRNKEILEPNNEKAWGKGYAQLVAGGLLGVHADKGLKIYNRGISGNKIPDLTARWQRDVINLKPDVLSILVGVNDLWHQFAFGSKYKATIQDFEKGYRELIQWTQREVPGVQIVICETFSLRTSEHFKPLAEYAAVCHKLAGEFNLALVPFQSAMDEATQAAEAKFWLWDGIHPTMPGHALMARTWHTATGI